MNLYMVMKYDIKTKKFKGLKTFILYQKLKIYIKLISDII